MHTESPQYMPWRSQYEIATAIPAPGDTASSVGGSAPSVRPGWRIDRGLGWTDFPTNNSKSQAAELPAKRAAANTPIGDGMETVVSATTAASGPTRSIMSGQKGSRQFSSRPSSSTSASASVMGWKRDGVPDLFSVYREQAPPLAASRALYAKCTPLSELLDDDGDEGPLLAHARTPSQHSTITALSTAASTRVSAAASTATRAKLKKLRRRKRKGASSAGDVGEGGDDDDEDSEDDEAHDYFDAYAAKWEEDQQYASLTADARVAHYRHVHRKEATDAYYASLDNKYDFYMPALLGEPLSDTEPSDLDDAVDDLMDAETASKAPSTVDEELRLALAEANIDKDAEDLKALSELYGRELKNMDGTTAKTARSDHNTKLQKLEEERRMRKRVSLSGMIQRHVAKLENDELDKAYREAEALRSLSMPPTPPQESLDFHGTSPAGGRGANVAASSSGVTPPAALLESRGQLNSSDTTVTVNDSLSVSDVSRSTVPPPQPTANAAAAQNPKSLL